MDGRSSDKVVRHRNAIESWMLEITADGGIDRYDDLHIDRINSTWKRRELWFPAALQAYELAIDIRDRNDLQFSVVLGFSLRGGERPKGMNFTTRAEFEREFNQTPPSLYLFRPEQEPWLHEQNSGAKSGTQDLMMKIDPALLGIEAVLKRCFYLEFKSPGETEFSRSVLAAA
jgi:hypothetical protein